MDRLTLMRSFVGVTKSRSFSQAARGLGISGSLVSRHVAELERDLGVRLVNRTARTVSPGRFRSFRETSGTTQQRHRVWRQTVHAREAVPRRPGDARR